MQVDHRKGPRRRGEALADAILQAAVQELADVGYTAVSMERIAMRARTSKAALYRRWSGRAELIVDAYSRYAAQQIETPDTGSLRTDVIVLLRRTADLATPETLHLFFGVLADAGEELGSRVREWFVSVKPARMAAILHRAEERGEVRPHLTERLRTLPLDLMRVEILQHGDGSAISDAAIEAIVDDVFLPLVRP